MVPGFNPYFMNIIRFILYTVAILSVFGCNTNKDTNGHLHDEGGGHVNIEDTDKEPVVLSYTLFSDDYELFVEFPALVVGKVSAFAAHFTELKSYKPVTQGKVTASIIKDGKGIRHSVEVPASPGIFRPVLQPKQTGIYELVFEMENENGISKFELEEIEVFANSGEAVRSDDAIESEAGITYLKEQAWKTEFRTKEVKEQVFYSVINTSARVKSQPQSEIKLNAQSAGIVDLVSVLGESVKKGDLLALITSAGIENNLTIKFTQYHIEFEKSKNDFIRTKPLAKNQVISQKEFLEIRSRYMQDSVNYFQMAKNISQNGLKVLAPFDGYISEITVSNGEYVENGQLVLTMSNEKQILIEAYVNQSDYQKVRNIFDAHFSLPSGSKTVTLSELKGKVRSSNAFVNNTSTRIPVTFSAINNGMLFPGMYLEAFLMAGKHDHALVIPISSVIEEQGHFYVFVQMSGESYNKRQIEIANNDGIEVEATAGLYPGERIVEKGAYQIKLASLAGDLPLHGHTH